VKAHPKHASSEHEILDVIRHRWSPRAFDAKRDVGASDLRAIFEAARWAPSSSNEQPWRFVVARRHRAPDAFARLLDSLSASNREWAQYAPLLALVATRTMLTATGTVNRSAWYDAGQAVALLTLQATGLGLGVRQMEGFDRSQARSACAVPTEFEPVIVMAVGYAGDPDILAQERHRAAERQPRTRHSIDTFVFEGVWGRRLGPDEDGKTEG
jgi:nitroreductase